MRFHSQTNKVFVRQSWLNDLVLCPERARLGIVRKDMRSGSDATIIGTATHSAIEYALKNPECTLSDMVTVALDAFKSLKETEAWRPTNINPDKYEIYIASMCEAWWNDIKPEVVYGGLIEHQFAFPLGVTVGKWSVWCEGTMDYVDPNGTVWDWKTASRSYNALEKQRTAIQATVYATAVVKSGLAPEFPVDFKYGVMIRQEKPRGQVVSVHRTEAHYRWLQHNVSPAVQSSILMGEDNHWIMNDSHHLCSENWCSYWSICKGAFVSPQDMSLLTVKEKEEEKEIGNTVTEG